MNIISHLRSVLCEIHNYIRQEDTSNDEILTTGRILGFIEVRYNTIESVLESYRFNGVSQEIAFYKHFYPQLLGLRYYYKERLAILILCPPDKEDIKSFYMKKWSEYCSLITLHKDFYQYCYAGLKYKDKMYFTGDHARHHASYWLGQEQFLQHFKKWLKLKYPVGPEQVQLKWTGSKVALIELLYGIHATSVVEGGRADIKQLAKGLEQLFNLNLGNYYRVYQDIRLRKKGQTQYIDCMKSQLIRKMDELDFK